MLVDFDKSFKKRPTKGKTIPKVLLDYLNTTVSKYNLEYIPEKDGICRIDSLNEKVTISGIYLSPTKEMLAVLGKKATFQDILYYSYNAQKRIPIRCVKENHIILNGKELDIRELAINPFCVYDLKSNEAYLLPPQMNEHMTIDFSGNTSKVTLVLKRIPDNSIDWIAYQTDTDAHPLSFMIKFSESQHKGTFTININMRGTERIQDIIDSMNIYNAFITGKGKISGYRLIPDETKNNPKYDAQTIAFWKKGLEIERRLELDFRVQIDSVGMKDIESLEYIYSSLVELKPMCLYEKPNTMTFNSPTDEMIDSLDKLHDEFGLFFSRERSLQLFGQTIILYEVLAIFGSKMDSYTHNGDELTLILTDAREGSKRYSVGMLFLTEQDLIQYEENHNILNTFSKVKRDKKKN